MYKNITHENDVIYSGCSASHKQNFGKWPKFAIKWYSKLLHLA